MRLLFVTQLPPYPLDSGGKVRNYYLLRHLCRQHRVTLVSFVRTSEEAAQAQELQPFCEAVHTVSLRRSRPRDLWHLARSFASRQPFLVARDASPALARLLQRLHRERPFDVVHVSPLTMAPYALLPPGPRRIVDCHDVMTGLAGRMTQALPWWLRPLAHLETRRLSRYEPYVVSCVDRALVVSEPDRRSLQRLGAPTERLSVVPIGIDSEAPQICREEGAPPHILHLGGLNYLPNLEGLRWFLRQIFPRIAAQLPDCRLYVVGRHPPRDVLEAAACERRISVVGYAREVEPYLAKASLLAVPLLSGSGMRVKILEAFARGLPVVATALGHEGIEATPGEHLLVADDPAAFAAAAVRLAEDAPLACRLTENARRLVKAKYDWRCVGQALDAAYDACVADATSACAPHRDRRWLLEG
jgi:glycosyltransferase involved in cell wall biosynthesis